MEEIVIKHFLGKNLKASAFDIDNHQAQTIQDFEISKIIGSLVKSLGYEIATDILGSNYISANQKTGAATMTIGNIFEWKTGRASPNDKLYIAFDSTNNKIYYWNNSGTTWTQLDDSESFSYDKARFFERDKALIISSGIGSTNYPIFIKYYDARTILGSASANQTAGYYDYRLNDLLWNSNFSLMLTNNVTGGDLTGGVFNYFACLVFDDVQNGDISDGLAMQFIALAETDNSITIKISISNTNGDAVNRRITHIKIFRQHSSAVVANPVWTNSYLLATIPFDNDTEALHVNHTGQGAYTLATLTVDGLASTSGIADDMFIGMYLALWQSGGTKVYKRITDNDSSDFTIADGTSLSDGETYMWEVVSYWWDNGANYECYLLDSINTLDTLATDDLNRISKKSNPINFKYLMSHDKRTIYAPLYMRNDSEEKKSVFGVSNINGDGNAEHDIIRHFVNLKDYGVEEITAIGRILNFVIIFTYVDIFKLNIASGNIFSWNLEETLENVGLNAPDSLTYIWGSEFKYNGLFYRSDDGYRVYDGYKSILLSIKLEEENSFPFEITTPSEAIGGYDPVKKQWLISYPTDSIVHKFDLITGEWLETGYTDEIDEFCVTKDGRLLGTDGDKIVVFTNDGTNNLTTHDGTSISPSWKSKAYNNKKPGITKIAKFVIMTYKSNTTVRLRWYLDRSTTAKTMNNSDAFPAQSDLKTKVVGMPMSQRYDEIELEIDLNASDKATNTILQIDEIRLLSLLEEIRM